MIETWYAIISFMLITYVVLDGKNFGAGILHRIVAKTPIERRQVLAALGPMVFWDEVWLVGFGGTLIAVFPQLMASAFSGYYFVLFLILWCLVLRGISLEVAGHMDDRLWQTLWDFVFSGSCLLLAIIFGAAMGNMARGVPLDSHGNFSMEFFTDFGVRGNVGILDWYTLSIALFAVVLLAAHGATYLTLKTEGPVHDRSEALGKRLWLAVIPLLGIVSLEGLYVRPDFPSHAMRNPLSWLGLLVLVGAAIMLFSGIRNQHETRAFLGSCFVIAGLLGTAAATIFPVMLYSTLAPQYSLTAYSSASSQSALMMAIIWWPMAFILAAVYFVYLMRHYSGKVRLAEDTQGYIRAQGTESDD
jgi:cytochrome d ubiquinol oxidase subunit II